MPKTFYNADVVTSRLIVRYAVGGTERAVTVDARGLSHEEHMSRLEFLLQGLGGAEPESGRTYMPWALPGGGLVSIRADAVVSVETVLDNA